MANIMIVDDSPLIRRSLRERIEMLGHRVVAEAEDGKEAVRTYLKHRIDLVTMDIQLPGMDGIEAVRQIREYDPKAAIVMISSVEHRHKVVEAIKLGARHYIVKPYTEDKISEVIQAVLGLGPVPKSKDKIAVAVTEPQEETANKAAKKPAPLTLEIPPLAALPYELVLKDGRAVLTIQRHLNEANLRFLQASLQGLLYYRKAKYVIEMWEPVIREEGLQLIYSFVSAIRARNGTVGIVTADEGCYRKLQTKLQNGVYRSYADIKW